MIYLEVVKLYIRCNLLLSEIRVEFSVHIHGSHSHTHTHIYIYQYYGTPDIYIYAVTIKFSGTIDNEFIDYKLHEIVCKCEEWILNHLQGGRILLLHTIERKYFLRFSIIVREHVLYMLAQVNFFVSFFVCTCRPSCIYYYIASSHKNHIKQSQ